MVAFNGVTGHRHGRETIEQEMAGVRARFVRGSKDRHPWHTTTGLPNLIGPGLLYTHVRTGRIRNNRSRCKQVSVCVQACPAG